METAILKSVKFMTQSQYNDVEKEKNNLYLVEFQPDLNMFPDYSKGVTLNGNTTYTVGSGVLASSKEGWFRIGLTSWSWHGRAPQLRMYLNGQVFYISYQCAFTMVYLSNGDKIRWEYTHYDHSLASWRNEFFPVKTT